MAYKIELSGSQSLTKCRYGGARTIVGKGDFASGNRFLGEYFSEFSGVFF